MLKPGGRLAIADVVATAILREEMRADLALLSGCVSGAATLDEARAMLAAAGFEQINLRPIDERAANSSASGPPADASKTTSSQR